VTSKSHEWFKSSDLTSQLHDSLIHVTFKFNDQFKLWLRLYMWREIKSKVAVCCSVLQYIAVCCSVLQCVAVCCRVLQDVKWSRKCALIRCVPLLRVACNKRRNEQQSYRVACLCCTPCTKNIESTPDTGWRRLIGSPKLQIIFAKELLIIGLFCRKWCMKTRHLRSQRVACLCCTPCQCA